MSTERKIKDYLTYYMNATYMAIPQHSLDRKPVEARIRTWYSDGTEIEMIEADAGKDWPAWFTFYGDIKPILRPLSDMTEEEIGEYNKLSETLFNMADGVNQCMQNAACVKYLLSLGFDLFNLIPDGLAINKTTLKP